MAGSAQSDDEDIISGINVTPLVDIMLVLLIIFMLTANVINRAALEVELPEAATGETAEPTTLALTLNTAGELYFNGELTSYDDLRTRLPPIAKDDPKAQAIIAADKEVSHGAVIGLIDLIRTLGIYRFALNIQPVPQVVEP